MAGRGPRPKDPDKRAGHGGPPQTILRWEYAPQPELPPEVPWPEMTLHWWRMWGEAPQSELFGSTDWSFLLDTALIHADVWSGNLDRTSELRLRVSKFGATIEDRARLRLQFADADKADAARPEAPTGDSARERYGSRFLASVTPITGTDD